MKMNNIIEINIYNSKSGVSTSISVEQLSSNIFRTIENEMIDCRLVFGTEFETKVNTEGKHEIARITQKSKYTTKRFILNNQFKESEYRLLGDGIEKAGGFWQIDFGNVATVNLPKNYNLDIDKIFEIFDFKPLEIPLD